MRIAVFGVLVCFALEGLAQPAVSLPDLGAYPYQTRPEGEAFRKLNPRQAPEPGELLLRAGDRLAIVGDSITEQKMYSRLIECYLAACMPELRITVRQYGWSGEKTDGFLKRMDSDCLRFQPTIATLCYGMNDSRYRPFDVTNGQWYEDHYTAIVRKFKQAGARVVVGSPGCAGKLATWVTSRVGTLDEHNQHLCALRDIAIGVAHSEQVAFADIFWPMYTANIIAPGLYPGDGTQPYELVGRDGIHPDWSGHAIMAYAFLRAMGLDGELGSIAVDLTRGTAQATGGHQVQSFESGQLKIVSTRYPFCASGPIDRADSVRSGMSLVPFDQHLNRLTFTATGLTGLATITWGGVSRTYSAAQLAAGINLAADYPDNPFCDAFARVDAAVAAKQEYETRQVKTMFHGPAGKANLEQVVAETEKQRQPLADAVRAAVQPVTHSIQIVW